ncbi:putative cytochrome p450 protein [Venturia nashicola]|nr:putative cytochrome p450 protein [Venturia nashicola]
MLSKSLISFGLLLSAVSVSASRHSKRADSQFNLYAYGTNVGIGGLPLFNVNGSAYIAIGAQFGSDSENPNVTFTMTDRVVSIAQNDNSSTEVGANLAFNESGNDYISFTTTPSTSQTTSGFFWFGNLLFFKSAAGVLSSSFYAEPTGRDGIWKIQWLADKTKAGKSVPIAFKRDAPGRDAKVT